MTIFLNDFINKNCINKDELHISLIMALNFYIIYDRSVKYLITSF